MPTRKITRSPVKVTGTVPDGQKFESFLEEEFFTLLRFDHKIERFEEQPITIEWKAENGDYRKYTPDALITYKQKKGSQDQPRPLLCEVKPDEQDKNNKFTRRHTPPRKEDEKENELKWKAAHLYASRHGWLFKVFRESDIRTPYLENARFLLRYLEHEPPSQFRERLLKSLEDRTLTLKEWVSEIAPTKEEQARIFPECYWLIATRTVHVDLNSPLTLHSPISLASENE